VELAKAKAEQANDHLSHLGKNLNKHLKSPKPVTFFIPSQGVVHIAPRGIPCNIFTNPYNNNQNPCSLPSINPNRPIKFTLVSIQATSSFNM
jgi:hypothetical protein